MMRRSRSHLTFVLALLLLLVNAHNSQFQAHAAPPSGPLIKDLSSRLKWTTTMASSKAPQSDGGDIVQFEDGYLVENVARASEIGVVPYKIRVPEDGELFAVDEVNSNIVKITTPCLGVC